MFHLEVLHCFYLTHDETRLQRVLMLRLHTSSEMEAKPFKAMTFSETRWQLRYYSTSVKTLFSLVRSNVRNSPLVFPTILLHEEARWNNIKTIVAAVNVVLKPNSYCIVPLKKEINL